MMVEHPLRHNTGYL